MVRIRLLLLAALIAIMGFGLWFTYTELQTARQQAQQFSDRIAELERRNTAMETEGQKLAEEMEGLRTALEEATGEKIALSSLATRRKQEIEKQRHSTEGELEDVRTKLQESESMVTKLTSEIADLRNKADKTAEDQQNTEQALRRVREEVAAAKRVTASLEQQLRERDRRLASLETGNEQLRERRNELERQNQRLLELTSRLEDTYRQRETYLSSILRRFRDLADDLRTSGDAPGQESGRARIQNMVSMTEEDLRQINTLNGRANRLLSQMSN